MTTLNITPAHTYFVQARAPRASFAARLASLQARHEQTEHVNVTAVAGCGALALVPFLALASMFVAM